MKKLFSVCLLSCWLLFAFAQTTLPKNYVINGITDTSFTSVDLVRSADNFVLESAKTVGGHFSFKGKTEEPFLAYVRFTIPGQGSYMPRFILENANYNVSFKMQPEGDFNVKISGGNLQETFGLYQTIATLYFSGAQKINNIIKEDTFKVFDTHAALKNKLDSVAIFFRDEQLKFFTEYVNNNPDSYISPCLIPWIVSGKTDLPKMEQYYNGLTPKIKNSTDGKALSKYIQFYKKKTSVGDVIAPFQLANESNNILSFSKPLKNKYTLIDFWASWCGPCLQEMPYLKAAYSKYHDAGFDIVGISLDNDRAKWLNKLKTENYPWVQLIDKSKDSVAKRYGIEQIPFNMLVDENLKIVAQNLRGEQLIEALDKIIPKH